MTASATAPGPAPATTPPARILCVEDDPAIADLLVEVLSDEGFRVTVAGSGPEGFSALGARPDAVVCDIDLPGYDGLELLRRVRAGSGGAVPFVFLTAFGRRENQIEARRLGCDDFVTKPVDFELLLAVLANVLQRAAVQDAASEGARGTPPPVAQASARLTSREREILSWVARGKSSADIAQIVGISERTVNFHVERVMRKLEVSTRMQAAIACVRQGLLEI